MERLAGFESEFFGVMRPWPKDRSPFPTAIAGRAHRGFLIGDGLTGPPSGTPSVAADPGAAAPGPGGELPVDSTLLLRDHVRGTFAYNHPEKLIDFGWRSEHEMTLKSKAIIDAYYGSAPRLSYWNGCSTGGRQEFRCSR